jgi:hypothetical protein
LARAGGLLIEIEAPSRRVRESRTAADPSSGHEGKIRIPSLSGLLRGLGALVIVVAFAIFLFEGWRNGDDLSRYSLLIGHTLVLSLAGFASGHLIHEDKGARLLIALALAAVPVNFAFLGSMTYDHLTWDPETTGQIATAPLRSSAPGEGLSATTALTLAAAAVPVLGAAVWIGFLVMARYSALRLTGFYLLANAGLLIPTRDTSAISLVLLALGVLLAISLVRLRRRDQSLATGEGVFARCALGLPLLVIAGRSVWLYAPGELFFSTLSLIGYVALRQALRHIQGDSRWGEAIEALAVGSTFLTALFTFDTLVELQALDAAFRLPIATGVFVGLLVDLSTRTGHRSGTYQGAAALAVAAALVINLISFAGLLTALACLIGGIGIQVYAYAARQQSVFATGLIAALIGLGYLGIEALSSFTIGGWAGLVTVGVATVLAGSLIERHGRRIRAAMGNWNHHFRHTD